MEGIEILNQIINTLRPLLINGRINEQNINWLKTFLDKNIPFISSPTKRIRFDELFRVTINKNLPNNRNTRINEFKFLKYPPPECINKYGRANYIGQSILYATFDSITVFEEMKPKVGDLITISKWKLIEKEDLLISPIVNSYSNIDVLYYNEMKIDIINIYLKKLSQFNSNDAQQIQLLLNFISDCFTRNIDSGFNLDYFLSAYFANKILYELDKGNIEAIVYPSVASDLSSLNIAIKPKSFDLKYKIKEIEECKVISTPKENCSCYSIDRTGRTANIENDIIKW
ncbi:MAG: hypothetical protein ACOYLE_03465 [Bacteroidales bacterium]